MGINLFSHVLSILNYIFLLFEMNIEAKQSIPFVWTLFLTTFNFLNDSTSNVTVTNFLIENSSCSV